MCAPALRCSTRRVARCNAHLRKLTLRLCIDLRSYVRNLPVSISLCLVWGTCSNRIHSILTLAMRSGAFLHLVVTLTALVARLAHLSSALRHVLSALHAESRRLLDTLHVRIDSGIHGLLGLTTILSPTRAARRSQAQRDITATTAAPPRRGRRRSTKRCAGLHRTHDPRQ